MKILSPKIVILIHWGTFSSVPLLFNMKGSPEKFEMLLAGSKQNKSKVKILNEGNSLEKKGGKNMRTVILKYFSIMSSQ